MPYSAYFAERAEYYRKLAIRAPNGWQAECQLGLANLFLEMSCDMRLRELIGETGVQRTPDRNFVTHDTRDCKIGITHSSCSV
jgi:hypothetical protein